MCLPGTARTLPTPLFPNVFNGTVCDLDVLPCVATSRLLAVWDEEVVSTTSEKVVPGLKAPEERD